MWYFTELADKWDSRRDRAEEALDDYVSKNPSQFSILVATTIHTSMVIGSGVVDLLRLGDGAAKGTIGGVTQDALRVLGVAAPATKGLQVLRSAKNTSLAKLIVDVGGPRCSWINSTKALAQTGHRNFHGKLFARVEDLLGDLRVPLHEAGGISLINMTSLLRSIGANVGAVKEVDSVAQVIRHVKNNGSVVLVSLKGIKEGREIGGHAVYFFKNAFGQLKIMDRTGEYSTLAVLAQRYNVEEFIPRALAPLDNLFAKYIAPRGTAVLSIEVIGVTSTDPEAILSTSVDN